MNSMSDCIICFEKLKNHDIKILNCNCKTIYHAKCINKWLDEQDACPMCRKSTSSNERTSLIQYDSPIEEVESNVCSIVGLAVVLIIILIMVIVFLRISRNS